MSLEAKVKELIAYESSPDFIMEECEKSWIKLIDDSGESLWEVLVAYNKFRLRNLNHVTIKRPSILIGAVNDAHFPNFHTVDLLKVADVISLTTQKENADGIDRIYYSIVNDKIQDIITKFPRGFKPICFWDSQAEHGHPQPLGLASAPFATVASICHVFHSPAVKRMLDLFDYVLPVGRVFDEFLNNGKSQVLKLPFGLNWASMHHFNQSNRSLKDVDISVTFSFSDSPAYGGLRNQVLEKVKLFKEKYSNDYKIIIESNLNNSEYTEILNRSKISINVVGFNGPYNYRTCEIINAGALLFQLNTSSHGVTANQEEIFKNEEDYISFDLESLEEKLLNILGDEKKISRIARSGQKKLEENLSYENLFSELIKKIQDEHGEQISLRMTERNKLNKVEQEKLDQFDDFNSAAFLWEQPQKFDLRVIGAGLLTKLLPRFDDTKFFVNFLAILPELLDKFGFNFIHSIIAERNKAFADTLSSNDLRQNVIQIYSLCSDHVAMVYNMISISMENNWFDKMQLPALVSQAFAGKNWDGYDKSWLLRYPNLGDGQSSQIRYDQFLIPLLLAKENQDEWKAYRDYLLSVSNV
jgi:hypothetical protein